MPKTSLIKPVKGVRINAVEASYMITRLNDIRRIGYNARFGDTAKAVLEMTRVAEDALAVAEGKSRDREFVKAFTENKHGELA